MYIDLLIWSLVFSAGICVGRWSRTPRLAIAVFLFASQAFAVSPAEAVTIAAADAEKLDEKTGLNVRYFWHSTPVYTAPPSQAIAAGVYAEIYDFYPVLSFHVNSLSSAGSFYYPVHIAFGVWRVDIRDYKWNKDVWEALAKDNLYFNTEEEVAVFKTVRGKRVKRFIFKTLPSKTIRKLAPEAIATLLRVTQSDTPIVHGPWFLANTSRSLNLRNKNDGGNPPRSNSGYGYYDWFGVKVPNDFLKLLKIRLKDSIAGERDILEVVDESGVADKNRMIELNDALVGLVAFTRDTDDERGEGNAVERKKREDYKAKAREWYFPLWNKLPGLMLSDDAVTALQDVAPDFIGTDKSPNNRSVNDKRIHVGIACIRCHAGDVLQPVDGYVRKNFRTDKMALNVIADPNVLKELLRITYRVIDPEEQRKTYKELERQYFKLNFTNRLNEQRLVYRTAIQEVSGMDASTLARRYSQVYHNYVDTLVTPDMAARDWGVPTDTMVKAFVAYGGLNAVREGTGPGGIADTLGRLAKGGFVKRQHYEDVYSRGARIILEFQTANALPQEEKKE